MRVLTWYGRLPNIVTLTVSALVDPSHTLVCMEYNFEGLSQPTNLETLQIRAPEGFRLPAFSFGGGSSNLLSLSRLRVLELVGLRDASVLDFGFLGSLTLLEVLALGDCDVWDASVCESLGTLSLLKYLRLEAGGDGIGAHLSKALLKLELLERLDLMFYDPPPCTAPLAP